LTDYALYLITINRAFYLEKKNNSKNNGYEARRKQERIRTRKNVHKRYYEQKQEKKKKGMRLISFFRLFDGLYIYICGYCFLFIFWQTMQLLSELNKKKKQNKTKQ